MLLVIFGAGASYDSAPSIPIRKRPSNLYRLPLTDELFADRPHFKMAIQRFHRCQPVIPRLRHLSSGSSVERVLEELRSEGSQDHERHTQLAAIRYYLRDILWECQINWNSEAGGITNYKSLVDDLELWRKPRQERVCLVTFNYDTMLEEALIERAKFEIRNFHDYIAHASYKLIKLHGSLAWGHAFEKPIEHDADNPLGEERQVIDTILGIGINQQYHLVDQKGFIVRSSTETPKFLAFPALAIPVETKSEFECPSDHVDALRECIPEITKMLIIGWRAGEANFIQLLSQNLRLSVRVMLVSGSADAAKEPIRRLQQSGINGQFAHSQGGFTEFIRMRECVSFLNS